MAVKVSVLTVTFNNAQTILGYLESLYKYLPRNSEIIIVDNNSTDATVDIIESFKSSHRSNSVVLINNNDNPGFSVGNNQAAQRAKGDFLLILNPDIEIKRGSLEKLVSFIEDKTDVGILAPRLIMPDGKIQKSVKKLPTVWRVLKQYYLGVKNEYEEYAPGSEEPVEVEAVYGAAMLISKEVFRKIRGFDEKYFIYYEDLDLCRRIKAAGYKIVYYPKATFLHHIGGSRVESKQLPWGLRTLANFIPIRETGRFYHQIVSGNIYHGIFVAFIIRILIYIAVKTRIYKENESVKFL